LAVDPALLMPETSCFLPGKLIIMNAVSDPFLLTDLSMLERAGQRQTAED
jgi:hypothetical protein